MEMTGEVKSYSYTSYNDTVAVQRGNSVSMVMSVCVVLSKLTQIWLSSCNCLFYFLTSRGMVHTATEMKIK